MIQGEMKQETLSDSWSFVSKECTSVHDDDTHRELFRLLPVSTVESG